jgi:hypothetical protein
MRRRRIAKDRSGVSKRLHPSWLVLASIENAQHDRCVDVFARPDGSFGFEEFRRDPEDAGAWTPVSYFSGLRYASKQEALTNAALQVRWLTQGPAACGETACRHA